MKVLIIHPTFASQYVHIVKALCADSENQVRFLCRNYRSKGQPKNFKPIIYKFDAKDIDSTVVKALSDVEEHVNEGIVASEELLKFRDEENFYPDVIVSHPGWGSALFVRDIYPETPMISYIEYYQQGVGGSHFFDPLETVKLDRVRGSRVYNCAYLHAIKDSDWLICPTHWQASRVPKEFHHKLSVLHDGIDTDLITPKRQVKIKLASGLEFSSGDEIVTYVARGFETMRGFPTVMASLPHILKERPKAHILMIGSDRQSYGNAPSEGGSWQQLMSRHIDYDKTRVHWLGKLEFETYLKVLGLSSAHIYLTKPFILSWSITEAMAAGCNIVASATQTMREVIKDGHSGLLVDFFSAENVAQSVCKVLDDKDGMKHLGENARKVIEGQYALKDVLPLHLKLIKQIANREIAPPVNKEIRKLNPRIEHFYDSPVYSGL